MPKLFIRNKGFKLILGGQAYKINYANGEFIWPVRPPEIPTDAKLYTPSITLSESLLLTIISRDQRTNSFNIFANEEKVANVASNTYVLASCLGENLKLNPTPDLVALIGVNFGTLATFYSNGKQFDNIKVVDSTSSIQLQYWSGASYTNVLTFWKNTEKYSWSDELYRTVSFYGEQYVREPFWDWLTGHFGFIGKNGVNALPVVGPDSELEYDATSAPGDITDYIFAIGQLELPTLSLPAGLYDITTTASSINSDYTDSDYSDSVPYYVEPGMIIESYIKGDTFGYPYSEPFDFPAYTRYEIKEDTDMCTLFYDTLNLKIDLHAIANIEAAQKVLNESGDTGKLYLESGKQITVYPFIDTYWGVVVDSNADCTYTLRIPEKLSGSGYYSGKIYYYASDGEKRTISVLWSFPPNVIEFTLNSENNLGTITTYSQDAKHALAADVDFARGVTIEVN